MERFIRLIDLDLQGLRSDFSEVAVGIDGNEYFRKKSLGLFFSGFETGEIFSPHDVVSIECREGRPLCFVIERGGCQQSYISRGVVTSVNVLE